MKMELIVKMLVMLDNGGNAYGDDRVSDYGDILMMIWMVGLRDGDPRL